MQKEILEILEKVILENYNIEKKDLKLEIPPKKELGDFAFGGFQLAKDLRKGPNVIVEELKDFIEKNIKLKPSVDNIIESLEVAGPYLNIKVSKNIFTNQFLDYIESPHPGIPSPLGEKEATKKGTIIIDYIGANIGKPLHIGHMCTPNLGQTMINIYRKLGYNVIGDNHLGDWGIIFGKLIFAYKYFGEKKEELEKNAIEYLLKLYIDITSEAEEKPELEDEFRKTFKKLSSGDKEYIELWKIFTSYSIKDLRIQLKRLNVKPDLNIGESFFEGLELPKLEDIPDLEFDMKSIVSELVSKGIATKNEDNSVGVVFDDTEKLSSCILQKRDGTHGYLASDLAAIKYRSINWNPEKIIYFTDSRQQLHFRQAFNVANKSGWLKNTELFHAYNGFISLKDGAMSTRKGRIVKLDSLLDEAEVRAEKIILEKRDDIKGTELQNLSRIIGIGAIKYGYLKKNRETDVIFDWDEFMSFEGNSGPYIQYAYVRARKILEKSPHTNPLLGKEREQEVILDKTEEIELIKKLLDYRNILEETTIKNTPHILASYAYELTKSFNSLYNNVHILNEEDEGVKNLRLKLIENFSKTIKECFELLGIEMPEKM